MLIKLIQRKINRFKRNNLNLYRFIIGFLFFMGPLAGAGLLFFAPLVGYLFVEASSVSGLLIACSIIFFIAFISVEIYLRFWSKSELQFIRYSMTPKPAFRAHLFASTKFSSLFHMAILASFLRIDFDIDALVYVLSSYLIFFLTFYFRYQAKLAPRSLLVAKIKRFFIGRKLTLIVKVCKLLMASGGWLRLALFAFILITLLTLNISSSPQVFQLGFSAILLVVAAFLTHLLLRLMQENVKKQALFLNMLSSDLQYKFLVWIRLFCGFLLFLAAATCFL
jgi:hypothetical protein